MSIFVKRAYLITTIALHTQRATIYERGGPINSLPTLVIIGLMAFATTTNL